MTSPWSDQQARDYARESAAQGVALIAHALNACDNPATPYKFAASARRKFERIVFELVQLIDTGRIVPNPIGAARVDHEFQAFMRDAMKRPRRAARAK